MARNVLAATLLVGLILAAGTLAYTVAGAAVTCEDLLAGNTYTCTSNVTNSTTQNLDFTNFPTAGTLTCACLPTGSLKNPNFGASKGFVCGDADQVLTGRATANKIKGGYAVNLHNVTEELVFECTKD